MIRPYSAVLGVLCFALACQPAPTPPNTAADATAAQAAPETTENHRKVVLELFKVMNMERTIDASINTMLNTQLQANPHLEPFEATMREFFAQYMSWESLENEFVDMYMEAFTQREIEDLLAFYKTPTGNKAISRLPELMEQGAALGVRRVQENMPALQAKIKARIEELEKQNGGESPPAQ